MKPLLGFVLGDWTGIGPEQCARVLADGRLADGQKDSTQSGIACQLRIAR